MGRSLLVGQTGRVGECVVVGRCLRILFNGVVGLDLPRFVLQIFLAPFAVWVMDLQTHFLG